MADTIKVRAVRGRLQPYAPPRGGYVGYELVSDAADADHAVPGGGSYRMMAAGVDVPDSAFYRRALKRGDIERVELDQEQEPQNALRLPVGVADESES